MSAKSGDKTKKNKNNSDSSDERSSLLSGELTPTRRQSLLSKVDELILDYKCLKVETEQQINEQIILMSPPITPQKAPKTPPISTSKARSKSPAKTHIQTPNKRRNEIALQTPVNNQNSTVTNSPLRRVRAQNTTSIFEMTSAYKLTYRGQQLANKAAAAAVGGTDQTPGLNEICCLGFSWLCFEIIFDI